MQFSCHRVKSFQRVSLLRQMRQRRASSSIRGYASLVADVEGLISDSIPTRSEAFQVGREDARCVGSFPVEEGLHTEARRTTWWNSRERVKSRGALGE